MKKLLLGIFIIVCLMWFRMPLRPPEEFYERAPETFTLQGPPQGLEWPKDKETFRLFICKDKYEIEVLTVKPYYCT